MNLETQIFGLEETQMNKTVIEGMKAGSEAMKAVSTTVNVEDVDELIDDIQEQQDTNTEINEALSQQIGMDMDEDDLLDELNELEELEAEEQLIDLPDVNVDPATTV
eukprot:UN29536